MTGNLNSIQPPPPPLYSKRGYKDTIKFEKYFSKFFYRHLELIIKYNIWLKTLVRQGILKPIFYGDLANKFNRIVRKPSFYRSIQKALQAL